MSDDRCTNCRIPLSAVYAHEDGRCSDTIACEARRQLLKDFGSASLITPEGVTRIYFEGHPPGHPPADESAD